MPELLEVEAYRRLAEQSALGRQVTQVVAEDAWFLKRGLTAAEVTAALLGRTIVAARRRGKLLLLDTDGDGPVVGLRFGMSGRLVVDGAPGIDKLEHSSNEPDLRYDRFALHFADSGDLRMRDPRRLGGVELDPVEARLGVDALAVTRAGLAAALADSSVALKARLLDQSRVAGVGNLLADEMLWRASLSPRRASSSLSPAELRRLHRHLRQTLIELGDRGGSHTGDLMSERHPGGRCPADGTGLVRETIGGRTSYWCPKHQH